MAKLQRRTVFQVALENEYGADPGGSYQALLAREGSEIQVNGEQVTRDTLRNTLSPRGHVIGLKDQQITMPLELRGAGVDGGDLNVPEIDKLLKASSMQRSEGADLVIANVSGTFERGETLTNTTESNTVGKVADYTEDHLYIYDLETMPGDGDALEGEDSEATADVSEAREAYVYRPASSDPDDMPSVVARYFVDGIKHRVLGARCTFSIEMTVGQIPSISFTLNGLYKRPEDDNNPSPTYLDLVPRPVFGANLVIGDLDTSKVSVQEMTLDIGNDIQWRDDIQADAGRKAATIVDRDPTGSVNPEATKLADFDPYKDWEEANRVAVAVGIGSNQGERVRAVMPATQYTELPYGERNGIVTYQLGFRATGDDDEFMLIYS